ncbi:response regulator transcription factor [Polyangium sp. 15x6]|uniref:response regulator transcription factor n=1 Tax=Polyangium sp. 15x6 TaxID=3042687 RepID=UPI002499CC96|nr:response regulator transcription factor [Polyangium sp. 15x6]MDI3286822.1 response regulator transcription factor [Polyangium sp. 15x6]
MKVLIVEDDARVAKFVARVLTEEGYVTDICGNGADATQQAQTGMYDLIVLDWMLPDLDGLSVCRTLRRAGFVTPILMLTARGELRERVLGLETGADDYLVKPFEIEELLARIRALVRRSSAFSRLHCGDLEMDRMNRRALLRGSALDLTGREYTLLLHLAHRVDRVVPKSELLAHVWEMKFDPGTNLVEVHVSRLRDKLGAHAWMIETVRGVGYRLRAERAP